MTGDRDGTSHSSKTCPDTLPTVLPGGPEDPVEDETMDRDETRQRQPVVLAPGGGRAYDMGRIRAVFKADGAEAAGGYSISEWWLEPNTTGPGAHAHPEDDVFYVIEGTMSVLVRDRWVDAPQGSFVLVPGGVTHDFQNRSPARAGVLNLSHPGEFELNMPNIVAWFADNPPGDAAH
jgi:mannose-6-phosphate isomerase-like protein (cupin superfamily)